MGPFNINAEISIVADEYVKSVVNGVAGSNENDKHYNGVNPERDLQNVHYGDFRTVKEGDISLMEVEFSNLLKELKLAIFSNWELVILRYLVQIF